MTLNEPFFSFRMINLLCLEPCHMDLSPVEASIFRYITVGRCSSLILKQLSSSNLKAFFFSFMTTFLIKFQHLPKFLKAVNNIITQNTLLSFVLQI